MTDPAADERDVPTFPTTAITDDSAPLLTSTAPQQRHTRFAFTSPENTFSPSSPSNQNSAGWRNWHRAAFNRFRVHTLSVSPESNFAPAITLDMRLHGSAELKDHNSTRPVPSETGIAWAKHKATNFVEEFQEWILASLVGIFTACTATWVEFIAEHLADLRFGVCKGMSWLHRDFCCGSEAAVDLLNNRCLPAKTDFGTWGLRGPVDMQDVSPDPFQVRGLGSSDNVMMNLHSGDATWLSWRTLMEPYIPFFGNAISADFVGYILVSTALAVFSAVLCMKIAPAAAGSGIPELKTILGGFSIPKVLSPWTLLTKIVALAMSVASGLGLGKEGPMVHVGSCWAELVTRFTWKPLDASKRAALISAGSAAGVSTAFAAPVGGVLFALEEVSTYFPPSTLYKTLMCCVMASLVLKRINPSGSGNGTVFQLDAIAVQGRWENIELVGFVLVAAAGGLLGALFIKANVKIQTFRQRARKNRLRQSNFPSCIIWICSDPIREVLLVMTLFAVIQYFIPMLSFSSTLLMKYMFTRCARDGIGFHDIHHLCQLEDLQAADTPYQHNTSNAMLLNLSLALTVYLANALLTLGLNVPAGIFIPCLTIGSLVGRIFGLLSIRLNHTISFMSCRNCIHPGVYSLLGAVAVLGGVTRMTVSLVVIAFEMTGGLGYIVPFMLVTLVARWTSEYFVEPSVYDCYIRLKRLPFLHPTPHKSDHEIAHGKRAVDVMDRDAVCISLEQRWTINAVRTLTREYHYSTYPVVTDTVTKTVHGTVNRRRLLERLSQHGPNQAVSGRSHVFFGGKEGCFGEHSLDYSDLVEQIPIQVSPNTSLLEIHHIFLQLGLSYLIFTDKGALRGILTKKAFLSRLERLRGAVV